MSASTQHLGIALILSPLPERISHFVKRLQILNRKIYGLRVYRKGYKKVGLLHPIIMSVSFQQWVKLEIGIFSAEIKHKCVQNGAKRAKLGSNALCHI